MNWNLFLSIHCISVYFKFPKENKMVRPLSESNTAIKIALLFLVITLIIFVIGFSTPSWTVISGFGVGVVRAGLWQQCVEFAPLGRICGSSDVEGMYNYSQLDMFFLDWHQSTKFI